MATRNEYPLVRNNPVATFYYKGAHSHPVQRTVLRIPEPNRNLITGYEIREGNEVRPFSKAPIKSYRKDKIAKVGQCGRRLRARTPAKQQDETTLKVMNYQDFITNS